MWICMGKPMCRESTNLKSGTCQRQRDGRVAERGVGLEAGAEREARRDWTDGNMPNCDFATAIAAERLASVAQAIVSCLPISGGWAGSLKRRLDVSRAD